MFEPREFDLELCMNILDTNSLLNRSPYALRDDVLLLDVQVESNFTGLML